MAASASLSVSIPFSSAASCSSSGSAIAAERIEGRQHLVGFLVVEVHDQDRHQGVGRCLGPEVPIDDLKRAVGQFADHQRIDVTDLSQDAAEGVLLLLGMRAPVLGVGAQVAGPDAT